MKFWLIVFLFSDNGEFDAKKEYVTSSKTQCVALAGEVTKWYVNSNRQLQFYCVSDDHHSGRSIDNGVPLD